jgi:hypothetical protein
MAGISDQPALAFLRFGQRGEHAVEAAGESGEFVVAGDGDRLQITGASDPLGRFGEPLHRAQTALSDRGARSRGQQHASSSHQDEHQTEAG